MYLKHDKGTSGIAERFIRTLRNKICKYMTSISQNLYIDKLCDIVNKYNHKYHSTIKIKSDDVNSSIYIDFNIEKEPKKWKTKKKKRKKKMKWKWA